MATDYCPQTKNQKNKEYINKLMETYRRDIMVTNFLTSIGRLKVGGIQMLESVVEGQSISGNIKDNVWFSLWVKRDK